MHHYLPQQIVPNRVSITGKCPGTWGVNHSTGALILRCSSSCSFSSFWKAICSLFPHIDFFPFPCMQFGCIEDSPHVLLYFGDVSIPAATHLVEICRYRDTNEFNLESNDCRQVENVEFLCRRGRLDIRWN